MAAESEERPLGLMVPPVPAGVEIPPEPPDVGARALSVAARLLAGATVFFFLAFVFAYFYLRSLNLDHFWLPSAAQLKEQKLIHISLRPTRRSARRSSPAWCSACSRRSPRARQMKRRSRSWLAPAAGSLVLGLARVALQCIEFTVQNFGPTDGAFASVFCAWTGLLPDRGAGHDVLAGDPASPPSCARAACRRASSTRRPAPTSPTPTG